MARGDGVAVLGLAVGLGGRGEGGHGDVGDVEVAGLELLVGGLNVLLDDEVDAVEDGLVTVVVVEADDVDVLAVDPLAVHLEGAVAHGSEAELDLIHLLGAVRDGRQGRVRGDVGEVGVAVGELDDEGVVVGAGDARHLLGLAGGEGVIALNHGEVVTDNRGALGVGGGVDDALPAVLPVGSLDVGAVVELGSLEVEGELGGVVVDLVVLAGKALELAGLEVILRQRVKELEADLGALVLLQVERVDADRVVDVVAKGAAGGRSGLTVGGSLPAALLAAASEHGERTRGDAALHEVAASDTAHLLLSHTVSSSCKRGGQTLCPVPRSC